MNEDKTTWFSKTTEAIEDDIIKATSVFYGSAEKDDEATYLSDNLSNLKIKGISIIGEKDFILPVSNGGKTKLSDINLGKIYTVKTSSTKKEIETTSSFASKFSSTDEEDGITFDIPIVMKDENFLIPFNELKWLFKETCSEIEFDKTTVSEEMKVNLIKGIGESKGVFTTKYFSSFYSKVYKEEDEFNIAKDVYDELASACFRLIDGCAKKNSALGLANKDLKASLSLSSIRSGGGSMDDFINRYAFKKHIKIVGKAGVGKTFKVDQFAEESGHAYEFIAGHSGLESIDLLGYYTKNNAGNMVWMDGALAAAFRKASHKDSTGKYDKKCILVIDELLRIPARELSICVGSLTPSSRGTFKLRTNRIVDEIDGVGEAELLECPVENLWVVATTNIGGDFDVENIDTALDDRFRTIDVEMDNSTFRSIIESVDDSNNKLGSDVIDNFMKLKDAINILYLDQKLRNSISIRHVSEILTACTDKKQLFSYIYDLRNQICARDTTGVINEIQDVAFKDTIRKNFRK
jgi:hypothetical protein